MKTSDPGSSPRVAGESRAVRAAWPLAALLLARFLPRLPRVALIGALVGLNSNREVASSCVRDVSWSTGTISFTSPMRWASPAMKIRPVSSRSRARFMRRFHTGRFATTAGPQRVPMKYQVWSPARLPVNALTIPDRKRLEVARAVATRPKLLLLDEVMAGLNAVEIDDALEMVRTVHSTGVTVVLIEHNLDVIAEADWLVDLGPAGGGGAGPVVLAVNVVGDDLAAAGVT